MTSFSDQLRTFTAKITASSQAVFTGTVEEATRSIVEGSEITGAPGQPVDTGTLKGSWQTWYDDPNTATIGTNVEYAPYIEDGGNSRGPFTLRSEVGGWHSVAQTRAGLQRIVDVVTARVANDTTGPSGPPTEGA